MHIEASSQRRGLLREYVARHSADQVTEALDQVLAAMTSSDSDFATGAARRVLERSDW